MAQLHLDPGPVDGVFDQKTQYAVVTVQKYYNQPRTGVIDAGVQQALASFEYSAARPNSEADRVEIDLDRQVLTLFKAGQPVLLTTTSTGNGEHFCGGVDGCQYAITPTGHYHFYSLYRGWQKGKLGQMWNPYYFNGSIAVHGLESVPTYPASHGCSRIPMHIADYFYTLVHDGLSVFVVGTAEQAGNGYVGPVRNTPAPPAPPTTAAALATTAPTTAPAATTPATKAPAPKPEPTPTPTTKAKPTPKPSPTTKPPTTPTSPTTVNAP
jgi:peptidoglycan hydrolase-like protein with peptidoglycan-binding domain